MVLASRPGHADATARLGWYRQSRLRGADLLQTRAHQGFHGRSLASGGVHMQVQLLGCGDERIIPTSIQAMEKVHSLVVNGEHLRGHVEWLCSLRLRVVGNMRLDRVQRASRLTIVIV